MPVFLQFSATLEGIDDSNNKLSQMPPEIVAI
jgi:hypothetical protein